MNFSNPFFTSIVSIVAVAALVYHLWSQEARHTRRQLDWEYHRICINCGYDLRCSKRRCPECGTLMHTIPQSTRAMTALLKRRRSARPISHRPARR